jgi:hypothetical protein
MPAPSFVCSLAIMVLLASSLLAGEPPAPSEPPGPVPPPATAGDEAALLKHLQTKSKRDAAIEKACAFLLTKQNADGSFGEARRTAVTGLAIMALLAAGQTPDDPTNGPAIRNGIQFVLSQMRADGYLGQSDGSRMYGQGICTLMLTEAAGTTRDDALERRMIEACRRAVAVILKAQAIEKAPQDRGGWRYEPNSTDSDLSATGWQIMALRSAKNIGMDVPDSALEAAAQYVKNMTFPAGGYNYQANQPKPTLRGVGLLVLAVCDVPDSPEMQRTTDLILREMPKWQGPWFYYNTYYLSAGMYRRGDEVWNRFYPAIDELLLPRQGADGAWLDPPGNNEGEAGGAVYSTSMVILALSVHSHFLPIYQR